MTTLTRLELPDRPIRRGKVRDLIDLGDELLLVATDRISAFDCVLPTPIPSKGHILTQLSAFWFERLTDIVPNHLIDLVDRVAPAGLESHLDVLRGRSMRCRKARVVPIECVVRGYLAGSGWKDYLKTGGICGVDLPAGLRQCAALPEPIFTPATKAEIGDHDENISFERVEDLLGTELAGRVRDLALEIYSSGAAYAAERGIIVADTKFEFGLDKAGKLYLIDEVLTPDSSRFWPASEYEVGASPPSFDKQFVRDYLETLDWDKKAPGPKLPEEITRKTAEKYRQAVEIIKGPPIH